METFSSVVIIWIAIVGWCGQVTGNAKNSPLLLNMDLLLKENKQANLLHKLLEKIYAERRFDSILMAHQRHDSLDPLVEVIHRFHVPKVILTKDQKAFFYKKKFNAEVLAVLVLSARLDHELFEVLAETLDYIRQTRLLVIAADVEKYDNFKMALLQSCKGYNMTNVLLNFWHTNKYETETFYLLKPYPQYYWQLYSERMAETSAPYYLQHWWNLHNKTLSTFTDQTPPRSLVFADERGNLKLNGYVPRLILLFAERFNASLRMAYPLEVGNGSHYSAILKMMTNNLLDIPMTIDTGPDDRWLNMSDTYEMAQGLLMVPCAQPLTIREVYSILLNVYFFGTVVICTVVLSLLHSLIDYLFDGIIQHTNFVFSDRIFCGVLGQGFVARNSPWRSLKLVYLLLFFAGLNINTQFSANVNTLLTSPPYHRQIRTFDDLRQSPLKILVYAQEATWMGDWITPFVSSVTTTQNFTYFQENRKHFNTTYGYYCASATWQMFNRKQQYFTHKIFCTYEPLTVFRMIPWAVPLQHNSPYQEPMNYLIHRVHAMGLMDVWHSSLFFDMLKLKQISIRDPNEEHGAKVLSVNNLFWTWMIATIGLVASSLVFLMELWWFRRRLRIAF